MPLLSTNTILSMSDLKQSLKQEKNTKLKLLLSTNLNLALIKGSFNGSDCEEEFYRFIFKIKKHIISGKNLNVYLHLKFMDTYATQLMICLSELNIGNRLVFYWNETKEAETEKQLSLLNAYSHCPIHIVET